eukprot:EC821001.1.p1 GENE.EC821001.1~~EC821001.1.p1  ORF type:complete len:145 (+),score=45.10 EC821001.1:5-439(+)
MCILNRKYVHKWIPVKVPSGITVYDAANLTQNITKATTIPTLCYSPRLHSMEKEKKKGSAYSSLGHHEGVCRVCLVAEEYKTYKITEASTKIPKPENPDLKTVKYIPSCYRHRSSRRKFNLDEHPRRGLQRSLDSSHDPVRPQT